MATELCGKVNADTMGTLHNADAVDAFSTFTLRKRYTLSHINICSDILYFLFMYEIDTICESDKRTNVIHGYVVSYIKISDISKIFKLLSESILAMAAADM